MPAFSDVIAKLHAATGLSLDLLFLGIFAVIIFGYAFYFGRNRGAALVLSFYPAILLFQHFPYLRSFLLWRGNVAQIAWSRLAIFVVFLVLVHVAISRFMRSGYGSSSSSMFSSIVIAVAATVLLLVILYNVVVFDAVYTFSTYINTVLTSSIALFWGLVAPLAALFLVRKS